MKVIIKEIKTTGRKEAVNITDMIKDSVKNIRNGIVVVYTPHTTAGITINEAYDTDVVEDMLNKLNELVPYSVLYKHAEGNADAHIQSSITGSSVMIIVEDGNLVLGRWQGIFFMEFDGPRNRKVYIKILEG